MDCQERICSRSLSRQAIVQLIKMPARLMPARLMPACMSAVLTGWFFFVAVSAVGGQVPQQRQLQVQQLVKQLAQPDFDKRESAERQLIEIGSPAVDFLLEELIDCKPDVCSRIKRILQLCSEKCDEESLFKVLGVLRLRFEVSDQRIEPLLQRWAFQRRGELVANWREQGVVVNDPFEKRGDVLEVMGGLGQFRLAPVPQVFGQGALARRQPVLGPPTPTGLEQRTVAEQKVETHTRSNAELIRLVLKGTLEQNKKLVLNSKQGADGFEKKVSMVQKHPVVVTIGENWKGDYSIFDFDDAPSVLPISGLELQKLEINDTLLSAIKKQPISTVVLTECSVAANLKETLPRSVSSLAIGGSNASADLLRLVSSESPTIRHLRFEKSKFGEDEALMLRSFGQLTNVDLVRIDLEGSVFDGLATVRSLRRLDLQRCKFPASAFIEFREKRGRNVVVDFKPKAFLGVSADTRGIAAQFPRAQLKGACIVTTVVPGEGADRAGMKIGDEIFQMGDYKIADFDELRVVIAQYEVGDEATIKVRRDGKELTLKAKLGSPSE